MDELPELPFEQVLSYLNLEDRLKARAVSRGWYHKINSLRVNTLCYSSRSSEFIWRKNRWVSGAFAKNFISSTRFATFFDTFSQTILSSLKHLRLCALNLREEDPTAFTRTLNSFGKLEQLSIIGGICNLRNLQFNLNLPMLISLQFERVSGIKKLTLEAPSLRDVKILDCSSYLRVEIVHGESVERLIIDRWGYTEVKKLKNLQHLYARYLLDIDLTFLSSLQKLKEIHTNEPDDVSELFEQKQRLGRTDLKIYLCGLLLNGPHDPAINALPHSLDFLREEWLVCLAENRPRMANEISFYNFLFYEEIKKLVPDLQVDLVKRCPDLNKVTVYNPIENIQRFLNLLKNCENISDLSFSCNQPQYLFDRLPEHCAVQKLTFYRPFFNPDFLFRLKHLIYLDIKGSIDSKTIRRAFEELPALSSFWFRYGQKSVSIKIGQSKQFQLKVNNEKISEVSELNAAIKFITGKKKLNNRKKRKAKYSE